MVAVSRCVPNDQYRVTFRWEDGAAGEVWCGEYHD